MSGEKRKNGKIFYLMGKSAAGKDTVYKVLREKFPELKTVVPYTTRPMRDGECQGAEYHFVSADQMEKLKQKGKVIECRTYETILGLWHYFTADDGQIDLLNGNYLMIGTLESYEKMTEYFGREHFVPVYIYVEDGLRISRAIARERTQREPKYKELCRRFLADEEDFSIEKLEKAGIKEQDWFDNEVLEECVGKIGKIIACF